VFSDRILYFSFVISLTNVLVNIKISRHCRRDTNKSSCVPIRRKRSTNDGKNSIPFFPINFFSSSLFFLSIININRSIISVRALPSPGGSLLLLQESGFRIGFFVTGPWYLQPLLWYRGTYNHYYGIVVSLFSMLI
jgi:hypothetical protein